MGEIGIDWLFEQMACLVPHCPSYDGHDRCECCPLAKRPNYRPNRSDGLLDEGGLKANQISAGDIADIIRGIFCH
jgi:hypothetical protein